MTRGECMNLSQTLKLAVLAQLFIGGAVFAQTADISSEVDAEIEQLYAKPVSAASAQTKTNAVVTQTIVVPQSSQAVAVPVQKQPETFIESTPLGASRADALRKGRQEEELKTESKIVEKLEQSRLEDERKRAAVLFGDKFDSLQNQQAAPSQVQQQAAPVQAPSSQVQPIIINQNETLTRDAVREEMRMALSEDQKAITVGLEQRYFSANAGIGQYPDMNAIQGNYNLGAGFGTRFDYFLVEGGFNYSNYTVNANYVDQFGQTQKSSFDMNQYQGSLATKYQLLGGFVRPVLGGLVSYSYRKYVSNQTTGFGVAGTEFGTSHAVDLGILTGVDLEFNDKMSFGVDFKYMFNMSNKLSGPTAAGSTPVEKLQYFTTGLFARVNF